MFQLSVTVNHGLNCHILTMACLLDRDCFGFELTFFSLSPSYLDVRSRSIDDWYVDPGGQGGVIRVP